MNTLTLATIGGLVAVFTMVVNSWEKISKFLSSISSWWMEKINMDDVLSAAVYKYCLSNMTMIGPRVKVFAGCSGLTKTSSSEQIIAFDILHQTTVVFRKGLKILLIKPGEWRMQSTTGLHERSVDVFLPKIMWNSSKFIQECMENYDKMFRNRSNDKRFSIRHFYGKNKTAPSINLDDSKRSDRAITGLRELVREAHRGRALIVGKKVEDIVLDEDGESPFNWFAYPSYVMDSVENARQWLRSRQWYKSKKVPWRRGWLLHGDPGTGKSLLVKCLAQDLDLPIFIFDLASMNNEEFVAFWDQVRIDVPCMVLFEDFDSVFRGRENQTEGENKLSFDAILNCISGIEYSDGIFLVITTNNVDLIDPALGMRSERDSILTRPGRIDDVIHLKDMDERCRITMAHRILGLNEDALADVVGKTDGMTAAQFVEFCNRIALQMVNGKNYKSVPITKTELVV